MSEDESTVEIHVRPDGSYKVYGPVRVVDARGKAFDLEPHRKSDETGERVKLCRCGVSKTMPFCDESHRDNGFSSRPLAD